MGVAEEEKFSVPAKGTIDYKSNEPVAARCEVAVRLKPLGAGKSDIIHEHEKFGKMRLTHVDAPNHTIVFGGSSETVMNFPRFIATGEYTQEMVFEELMTKYIDHFLNGYSVNMMAYGQTGSGKTYTMLAPIGTFTNLPDGELGEMPEAFGLFGRAVISIFNEV